MEKLGWPWRANLATTMMARKNYVASRRIEEARLLEAKTRTTSLSRTFA